MSSMLKGTFGCYNDYSFGQYVAISPDNKQLVIVSNYRNNGKRVIAMYSIETSELMCTFEENEYIFCVKFSPDGKHLFTGHDNGEVKIWSLCERDDDEKDNKSPVHTIKAHSNNGDAFCIDISSKKKYIVTGSSDQTCKVFGLKTECRDTKLIRTFGGHTEQLVSVAFTQDEKCVVSVAQHEKNILVWNIENGEVLYSLFGLAPLALSLNSKYIVSILEDYSPTMWNAETGTMIRKYENYKWPVSRLIISSDNSIIVTASSDTTFKILDAPTSAVIETIQGHSGGVSSVAISSNNQYIASASFDGTCNLWDISPALHKMSWSNVKSIVMLRWLCEKKRANVRFFSKEASSLDILQVAMGAVDANLLLFWNTTTSLDKFCIHVPDDIFSYTLSFLVHQQASRST